MYSFYAQLTEPSLLATFLDLAPDLAQILALIYLILQLEDKRMLAIKARDESYRYVIDALVGVIEELMADIGPERVSARQMKYVKEFIAKMQVEGPPKGEKNLPPQDAPDKD